MYKNILIISDNLYLCKRFFSIIEKKKNNTINYTFSISPYSIKETFIIANNITTHVLNLKNQVDVDKIIATYDLVFSIHCKQIFPSDLVTKVKCINVHPGYNPINRGWYPQVFSILNDFPMGATIHEIDEQLDNGNIIVREYVDKKSYDTSETLYNKVIAKEIELLSSHIDLILDNNYEVIRPESQGNLFFKKDFYDLFQLNLEEQTTVGKVIDKLRALTHGDFKNAFFIDKETGKKVYVGIQLKLEGDGES